MKWIIGLIALVVACNIFEGLGLILVGLVVLGLAIYGQFDNGASYRTDPYADHSVHCGECGKAFHVNNMKPFHSDKICRNHDFTCPACYNTLSELESRK